MNLETLKALYSQMKSYEDKQWIGFLIAREERKILKESNRVVSKFLLF